MWERSENWREAAATTLNINSATTDRNSDTIDVLMIDASP
jgi:hypothetical protein